MQDQRPTPSPCNSHFSVPVVTPVATGPMRCRSAWSVPGVLAAHQLRRRWSSSIRASAKDEMLRNVSSLMLMGIYWKMELRPGSGNVGRDFQSAFFKKRKLSALAFCPGRTGGKRGTFACGSLSYVGSTSRTPVAPEAVTSLDRLLAAGAHDRAGKRALETKCEGQRRFWPTGRHIRHSRCSGT
jgi:hypothetical protein